MIIKFYIFIFCFSFQTFVFAQELTQDSTPLEIANSLRNARKAKKTDHALLKKAHQLLKQKVFSLIQDDLVALVPDEEIEKLSPNNLSKWLFQFPQLVEMHDLYNFKKNNGLGLLINELNGYSNYINMRDMMASYEQCGQLETTKKAIEEITCSASDINCQIDGVNNLLFENKKIGECTSSVPLVLSSEDENNLLDLARYLPTTNVNGKRMRDDYLSRARLVKNIYEQNALIAAQNYLHHKAILGPLSLEDFNKVTSFYPFPEGQPQFKDKLKNYAIENGFNQKSDEINRQKSAINKICEELQRNNYDFTNYEKILTEKMSECEKNSSLEDKFDQNNCITLARNDYNNKVALQKNALYEAGKTLDVGALIFTKALSELDGQTDPELKDRLIPYTQKELELFKPKKLNPDFNCKDTDDPNNFTILRSAVKQSNQITKHYSDKMKESFSDLIKNIGIIENNRTQNPAVIPDKEFMKSFHKDSSKLASLNPRAVGETIMLNSDSSMVPYICEILHNKNTKDQAVQEIKDMGKATVMFGGMLALGAFAAPYLGANAMIVGAADALATNATINGTLATVSVLNETVDYFNKTDQYDSNFIVSAATGDLSKMTHFERPSTHELILGAGSEIIFFPKKSFSNFSWNLPDKLKISKLTSISTKEAYTVHEKIDKLVGIFGKQFPQIELSSMKNGGDKIARYLMNPQETYHSDLKKIIRRFDDTNDLEGYAYFISKIGGSDVESVIRNFKDNPKNNVFSSTNTNTTSAKRIDYEKLSTQGKRFYNFVFQNEPMLERQIPSNSQNSIERLASWFGNENPNDMRYLIKKEKVTHWKQGGEGKIYLHPTNKNEALKIWKDSRKDDFQESIRTLMHFEAKTEKNAELAKYFHVSKILEKGPNYIVKEFFPNSIEMEKVTDPNQIKKMKKAISKIKKELLNESDAITQKLYQKLISGSENIHWDPETERIVLIDALGF